MIFFPKQNTPTNSDSMKKLTTFSYVWDSSLCIQILSLYIYISRGKERNRKIERDINRDRGTRRPKELSALEYL